MKRLIAEKFISKNRHIDESNGSVNVLRCTVWFLLLNVLTAGKNWWALKGIIFINSKSDEKPIYFKKGNEVLISYICKKWEFYFYFEEN